MVSARIAYARPYNGNLLDALKDWKELFDEERLVDAMGEENAGVAKKFWKEHQILRTIRYAEVRDAKQWRSNGAQFLLIVGKIGVEHVPNEAGGSTPFPTPKQFKVHVRIHTTQDGMLAFFNGRGEGVNLARTRLNRRLVPKGRKGRLYFLDVKPKELLAIRKGDTTSDDDVYTEDFREGDGVNDVAIRGARVTKSSLRPHMNKEHLEKTAFCSAELTKKVNDGLACRVTINGKTGTFTARVDHDTLHTYVYDYAADVIKRHRGGKLVPVEDE